MTKREAWLKNWTQRPERDVISEEFGAPSSGIIPNNLRGLSAWRRIRKLDFLHGRT
jgi:hypothetical protein